MRVDKGCRPRVSATRRVPSGGSEFGRALRHSFVKRKRYVLRMVAMLMAALDRLRAGVCVSSTHSLLACCRLSRPESSMATARLLLTFSVVGAPGDRSLALSLLASRFWPPFPPLLLLAPRCGVVDISIAACHARHALLCASPKACSVASAAWPRSSALRSPMRALTLL